MRTTLSTLTVLAALAAVLAATPDAGSQAPPTTPRQALGGTGLWLPSITVLAAAATSPPALYTATPNGLFISADDGGVWTPTPLGGRRTAALASAPRDPRMVYAITARLHRSIDGRSTGTAIDAPLPMNAGLP